MAFDSFLKIFLTEDESITALSMAEVLLEASFALTRLEVLLGSEEVSGVTAWGCSEPSSSASGCSGDEGELEDDALDSSRTEDPKEGLDDADDFKPVDSVGCSCCFGDTSVCAGLELRGKCTDGSEADGKVVEGSGDETSDGPGKEADGKEDDSTGGTHLHLFSGASTDWESGRARSCFPAPLEEHSACSSESSGVGCSVGGLCSLR